MPRRSSVPRLGSAVAAALIGVLALAPLATAALAEPGPGITDVESPTPEPSPSISEDPTPSAAETPPESPTPSPTPAEAPPTTPGAPPTTPAAQPTTPAQMLGVTVAAGNAVLGADYWTGNGAGSFVITVKNTGNVTARMSLRYTVPAGVTDSATGACRHGECVVDSLTPGAVGTLTVAVTVDGEAWRHAPLSGRVDFSATAPGTGPATGTVTWGVIFPPGPPAAGIVLQVADVTLDADATVPGQLVIRLTNTGVRPAAGVIDLVVPAGVAITQLPADCQSQRLVDQTTAECGLGIISAGVQRAIAIPLAVSDDARADSPLAGLVRAALTPSGQGSRSTQASYQIIAPQIQTGVSAASTASPMPPSSAAARPAQGNAAGSLIIFGSLLLLGLVGLGLVVLRGGSLFTRRPRRGGLPASATSGPWRPVATFVPLAPRKDSTALVAAGRAALAEPAGGADPALAGPVEPAERGEPVADGDEPEPIGLGEISLEWTELPDSTPPPGRPVS
jgi:hypothetical protein